MKKGVLLFILCSLFLISFIIAEDEVSQTIDDKAYTCLKDKLDQTNCDSLSSEGKIFALLTLGECKDEVLADSNFKSDLKLTSQAILALDTVGVDTAEAVDWIWAQNKTPTDMIWYLQIDSSEATSCTINYENNDYTINIAEDKKLDSNAGTCLTRATGNYWLQITPNCYDEEFEITCGESTDSLTFKTNLLFKRPNDNTIHVSFDTHSGDGGQTTTEKVEFLCFQKSNNCDYEGTLWATIVLDYLGTTDDLSSLVFYLTTLNDVYSELLPESFLYYLTGENKFENNLIQSQSPSGFWKVGTNKYYDTAVALLSVPSGSTSWNDAISWLEEEQADSGCWNSNNFVDTAFIVYSAWPRGVSLTGGEASISEGENCVDAGYFCMSGINCAGEILSSYDCTGFDKCCSKEEVLETCEDLNGEICNSNQQCSGGTSENTFDLNYGQSCCINGACETKVVEEFTCESSRGICRIDGCDDNEESSYDTCEFGDTCCVTKTSKEKNYLWLWILIFLILIGLVILGIFKKDKLRELWFRLKSKFKKSSSGSGNLRRPPRRPSTPASAQRRIIQGRTSPPRRALVKRPSKITRPSSKAPSEINDVLKRLKEMGK
ncbi:MAG: hypothetical protein ABFQ65_00550 [Nanoarchaeota archaeon]